jgi:hypothetical protein
MATDALEAEQHHDAATGDVLADATASAPNPGSADDDATAMATLGLNGSLEDNDEDSEDNAATVITMEALGLDSEDNDADSDEDSDEDNDDDNDDDNNDDTPDDDAAATWR